MNGLLALPGYIMRSMVYASVWRPSVRLSGLLLRVRTAGDIDQLLHDAQQRGVHDVITNTNK